MFKKWSGERYKNSKNFSKTLQNSTIFVEIKKIDTNLIFIFDILYD
ncbi:MAG: hypothetical protein ACI4UG_04925 [Candidatus Onthovivens sp.]